MAELTVHAHKGHHSTINFRVRNPRRLATYEQRVRADVERVTDPKQRFEVGFPGIGHVPGVSGLAQAQAFGDLGVGEAKRSRTRAQSFPKSLHAKICGVRALGALLPSWHYRKCQFVIHVTVSLRV
nr:hypothetical protein [Nitrospirillum amazonense]